MRKLHLPIIALIIAALACGSSATATQAPGATSAPDPTTAPASLGKVGERVEANGMALTVHSVSATELVNEMFKPEEGNVFVVVDVTIESVDQDAAAYNPLFFKVKDDQAFEYNMTFMAPDPTLKSGELAAGEKVRGNVAFEVPADATGLVLAYQPINFSGDDAIRFELGDAPAP